MKAKRAQVVGDVVDCESPPRRWPACGACAGRGILYATGVPVPSAESLTTLRAGIEAKQKLVCQCEHGEFWRRFLEGDDEQG